MFCVRAGMRLAFAVCAGLAPGRCKDSLHGKVWSVGGVV